MSILAIDFGGTRTRAGWFDDSLTLRARAEVATGVVYGQNSVIGRLLEVGRQVIPPGAAVRAVGVAAPGPLDAERGVILHAATLPGWRNVPLAYILTEAFNAPAFIQNDGNLGALAEYHRGGRAGSDPLVYMTLSTGIGGGAVIGGRLFTGAGGLAIEPGHVLVTLPGGAVRKLEQVASGTALGQLAAARGLPFHDGRAVGTAAQAGDPAALALVQEAGRWLGVGLVSILHLLNPQAVVFGGSVTALGDLLFAPMREAVRHHVMDAAFFPPDLFSVSTLGGDVCLIGAAHYAQTRLG
jgi:glucokinase